MAASAAATTPARGPAALRAIKPSSHAVAAPTSDCATFTRAGVLDGTGRPASSRARNTG